MTPSSDDPLHFDRFELQPRERRLLAGGGEPVLLGARAFDLLLELAQRPDQLVTRGEILERVWPDVLVEENNIAVQISNLRKVLGADAITTVPGRGYRFMHKVRRVGAAATQTPAAPQARSTAEDDAPVMFGRQADLERAETLTAAHRVVTLAGPAGVGKSALARMVMRQPAWAGRRAWVDLAALSDGAALPVRIAEAMQWNLAELDPMVALVQAAARAFAHDPAPRWLVLDNAEHLVVEVARVVDALAAVASLHVLTTSQLPLNIDGEQLLRLEPLAVPVPSAAAPRPAAADVAHALEHGAVALFVERARAADRRFALTPERVSAVVQICRQLDGLPLALEMAAACVPLLGLDGLRQSLAERVGLPARTTSLHEARHRTLEAAIEWSHALLDETERTVLRRCAVFNGGFTLELFSAVVPAAAGRGAEGEDSAAALEQWPAVDALGSLVARSLVMAEGLDTPRYRLLETVRAYAVRQLQAAGEADRAAHRHALALRELYAHERGRVLDGHPAHASMPRCAAEFDNLGSAVDWCLRQAPPLAVELVALAGIFTVFSARRRDAERWLAACEPHVAAVERPAVQGVYWLELTRSRVLKADARAAESARRALAIFTATGDELGEFQALGALLRSAVEPNAELDQAAERVQRLSDCHPEWPDSFRVSVAGMLARWASINERFEQALQLRRDEARWAAKTGNPPMQRAALSNVVHMLGKLERHAEAIEAGQALLEALRGQSDHANRAYTCLYLATSLTARGRLGEATAAALEGEAVFLTLDLPLMTTLLALIAARRGWPRSAARLAGWASARYEARQLQPQPEARTQLDEALTFARQQLGETTLELELGRGRALDDLTARDLLRSSVDVPVDR